MEEDITFSILQGRRKDTVFLDTNNTCRGSGRPLFRHSLTWAAAVDSAPREYQPPLVPGKRQSFQRREGIRLATRPRQSTMITAWRSTHRATAPRAKRRRGNRQAYSQLTRCSIPADFEATSATDRNGSRLFAAGEPYVSRIHYIRVGVLGRIGRFASFDDAEYGRGCRVICQTPRGLEVGEVLRSTNGGSQADSPDGNVLRPVSREDERTWEQLEQKRREAYAACVERLRQESQKAILLDVGTIIRWKGFVFLFSGAHHARDRDADCGFGETLRGEGAVSRCIDGDERGLLSRVATERPPVATERPPVATERPPVACHVVTAAVLPAHARAAARFPSIDLCSRCPGQPTGARIFSALRCSPKLMGRGEWI